MYQTKLPKGESSVQFRPDFQNWELDTLSLAVSKGEQTFYPKSQSWLQPLKGRNEYIAQLVGSDVELFRPGRDAPLTGQLQAWSGDTGLLLLKNDRQEVFQWGPGYSLRTLHRHPLAAEKVSPYLNATFRLKELSSNLSLNYFNRGLSYSNQYRLVTQPETNQLNLELTATLSNNSDTDYTNSRIQLASGDVGGMAGIAPRSMMIKAMSVEADGAFRERAGDLLFVSLPDPYTLPAGSELKLPLIQEDRLPFETRYRYSFYGQSHPGSRPVQEHPVRELRFTPQGDLPAGSVQVYEKTEKNGLRMVNLSQLPQAAGGLPLDMTLGESYSISVERQQLGARNSGQQREVDWQVTVRNQHGKAVELVLEDTSPALMSVLKVKGLQQKAGTLVASIPAESEKTFTFTTAYRKN